MMDFEFILKVAERRVKAALGKAEEGKISTFTTSVEAAGSLHRPRFVAGKKVLETN